MKSSRKTIANLLGLVVAVVIGIASVPLGPFGIVTTFVAVTFFKGCLSPWVEAGKS